jgi:1D-myo-inositol 3-kinase
MGPDYLVIGHVTRDIQKDGSVLPGGTVTYAALTARNLGRQVGVVTSCANDIKLDSLLERVEVASWPAEATTTFENVYLNGRREQYVRAVASPLRLEHIPEKWREVPLVHLGPLVMEVSSELIDAFPRAIIGVTPQGWMRRWDASGLVSTAPWASAQRILSRADVLILSEEDTGGDRTILDSYLKMARLAVVTDGRHGAVVCTPSGRRSLPAYCVEEVDPTGAGDVFAAAYLTALSQDRDPYRAAQFANAVASFSVEARGLAGIPLLSQVRERLTNGVLRTD